MKKLTAGIFFTMAGSWAVALRNLGVDIAWHYCVPEFHEVFKLNFPKIPVSDKWSDLYAPVDLIVGSPPCIGMSVANPLNYGVDHPANQETLNFAKVVNTLKPKGFVMEMVWTFLKPKFAPLFEEYKKILEQNYNFKAKIINFVDYGVPQLRRRVIIMGLRKDIRKEIIFPLPLQKRTPISTAFKGLPRLTEDKAVEQKLTNRFNPKWKGAWSYYIRNPKYFQLEWEGIAHAITNIDTKYFKHPDFLGDDPKYRRLITYREAARIMEYPDNFQFIGNLGKKFKQISWGVPCKGIQLFIKKIVKIIKEN